MIAVGPMLDSVSGTLLDRARRTWSLAELVQYTNEALAATAAVKPDMFVRQEAVSLVAGTLQRIPDGGVALLNVTHNEVSGRVITQVDGGLLNEANRFWPAATRQTDVEHFAADPRDPTRFDVTPPNDGTGSVQMTWGAVPDPVTGSSGEELDISPSYEPILINYILGRCYEKNTTAGNPAKAMSFKNQWGVMVGLKSKGQATVAPRSAVSPEA